MKQYRVVVISVLALLAACVHALDDQSVGGARSIAIQTGQNLMSANLNGVRVDLQLTTRVTRVEDSGAIPKSCTRSRIPCTAVETFELSVNGSKVFVPNSALCAVSDLTRASVVPEGQVLVVRLQGGDASESFELVLKFDTKRLLSRELYSGMDKRIPIESTTYQVVLIGE